METRSILICSESKNLRDVIKTILDEYLQSFNIRVIRPVFLKEFLNKEKVDIILIDLPYNYDAIKTLKQIKNSLNRIYLIYISNCSFEEVLNHNNGLIDNFLQKPFSFKSLIESLNLEKSNSLR